MSATAILLAGGQGSRMNSPVAKQFLELEKKPLILYSFEIFLKAPDIDEVVVVCSPDYQYLFKTDEKKRVTFALPGVRRQDSVYNGLLASSKEATLVCVHDGARPFVTQDAIIRTIEAAKSVGAAAVGMPV